jgi:hypothetical protein
VVFALSCAGPKQAEPASTAASAAPTETPPARAPLEKKQAAAPAPEPKPTILRDGPRVYAKTRYVWIHSEPGAQGWIGFLWFGGSVKLKSPDPLYGPGCMKWYAIEPRGFVCVDGERATLDPDDPALKNIIAYAPNTASPWPHRYAESRGAYRYPELPSESEQRMREWDLAEHKTRIAKASSGEKLPSSLEGVDLSPAPSTAIQLGKLPPTIRESRDRMLPLSTVAYSAETRSNDRSYLLSADLMWVPKDRVAPYPKVTFRGLFLGKDAKLPLALFRTEPRAKFKRGSDGQLSETAEKWARLSFVELTGQSTKQDGDTFLETRDSGFWLKQKDAVVPTPQEKTPWGAPVNGEDTKEGPAGRRTWLEASVWKGWMIAYEGTKPIFVTLIAPGRGGTVPRNQDPLKTAATPTGTFPITGKFATATMVAPGEFIHSDVPWAQNFSGPHALHGAYWHDDWGNRKSGGCVNVSPIDGKWLFEWTEPPIPDGWHGVRWRPTVEPATTFVVHD